MTMQSVIPIDDSTIKVEVTRGQHVSVTKNDDTPPMFVVKSTFTVERDQALTAIPRSIFVDLKGYTL